MVMVDDELVMGDDRWMRGWPKILHFLGYKNKEPVLNLRDRYEFPLRRLPSGEPVLVRSEANEWLRAFSEASSPFRMQKLSGAALAAHNGVNIGVRRNPKAIPAQPHKLRKYQVVDWSPSVVSAVPAKQTK